MTLEELKASLTEEEISKIKATADKSQDITEEDRDIFKAYIDKSSEALGEDQIAEPLRYILASMGGLRSEDLKALIGEDFDESVFEQWNNLLETPVFTYRDLPNNCRLYDVAPKMRGLLRKEYGDSSFRSCASDIGYYLLEHKQAGDIIRDTQCLHLLLDGNEAAAAAEYISEVEGDQLRMAVNVLANGFKDAPDYVKDAIFDMIHAEGEKINKLKLLMLMLNDCVAIIGNPEPVKPMLIKLHDNIQQLMASGNTDITILLGIAKLRIAQNARLRRAEEEAQKAFIDAMNYLMPPLQNADHTTISDQQIHQYWLCLKICQEMAQPKAMAVIFEQIIKVEKAQSQDPDLSDDSRANVAENILNQHIDMSKTFYQMPKPMQDQFTNYTEPTIALLKAFVETAETHNEDVTEPDDLVKLAGYYQSLGELTLHLERFDESYEALTEAQILQMRQLAAIQKEDGPEAMSPRQLVCRLALSATNHMIAAHYRRQGKSQHDLGIILRSNMNLAEDCFKFYHFDPRVIHFLINAALELGDYQHNSRGFLAECGTYEKVLRQFPALNNMRLDQQLATDIAMIHTKCGQIQADNSIRRFKDAVKNLEIAHRLWKTMADNTKNPQLQKNAEAVMQMIEKLKK